MIQESEKDNLLLDHPFVFLGSMFLRVLFITTFVDRLRLLIPSHPQPRDILRQHARDIAQASEHIQHGGGEEG